MHIRRHRQLLHAEGASVSSTVIDRNPPGHDTLVSLCGLDPRVVRIAARIIGIDIPRSGS